MTPIRSDERKKPPEKNLKKKRRIVRYYLYVVSDESRTDNGCLCAPRALRLISIGLFFGSFYRHRPTGYNTFVAFFCLKRHRVVVLQEICTPGDAREACAHASERDFS